MKKKTNLIIVCFLFILSCFIQAGVNKFVDEFKFKSFNKGYKKVSAKSYSSLTNLFK